MRWFDRVIIGLLMAACVVLVYAFTELQHKIVVPDTTPVTIVETPTTVDPDFTVACFDTYDLTRERCT